MRLSPEEQVSPHFRPHFQVSGRNTARRRGDVLRFVVTPRQDGFVGVVGIDGAGAVNAYAPQGTELVPAKAGQALALDGGIELDQVLGRERLTVFACAERLTRAALLEPVAALVRQGRARPEKPLQVRQGCVQSSLWFEKVQAR